MFSFTLSTLTIATVSYNYRASAADIQLLPKDQSHLEMVIWSDADDKPFDESANHFFRELLCSHKNEIDWEKMVINLKFGAMIEQTSLNDEPRCPISHSRCSFNLLYYCYKKYVKNNHKKTLDYVCCHKTDPSPDPMTVCAVSTGIATEETATEVVRELVQCTMDPQQSWNDMVQIWRTEGQPVFPKNAVFPANIVNGEYYYRTDYELKNNKFFSTACRLYAPHEAAKNCPADY